MIGSICCLRATRPFSSGRYGRCHLEGKPANSLHGPAIVPRVSHSSIWVSRSAEADRSPALELPSSRHSSTGWLPWSRAQSHGTSTAGPKAPKPDRVRAQPRRHPRAHLDVDLDRVLLVWCPTQIGPKPGHFDCLRSAVGELSPPRRDVPFSLEGRRDASSTANDWRAGTKGSTSSSLLRAR